MKAPTTPKRWPRASTLPDPTILEGYISEIATRGLIFIEADNPDIGLMAFLAIGIAEVSTCDIRVYEGQRIKKGDEIGMFHFGGSTHCLIFRPEVDVVFDLTVKRPGWRARTFRPQPSRASRLSKEVGP